MQDKLTDLGRRTNEIAKAVREGAADIMTLWEAVRQFAVSEASRWARAFDGRSGVTGEDLEQVAFIALLDAIERWEPDRGGFNTCLGYYLKRAFAQATSVRTERLRRDPLNNSPASLDLPIMPDSDLTLGEIICDPSAEAAFDDVEERELEQAVAEALSQLPENERTAMVDEFWHGRRADERTRSAALRHLRHPGISRTLREWV